MQITGDSPMIRAWQEGCDGYVPQFAGLDLAVEMSDPGVSESNLNLLLGSGRRVCAMHVGPGGNILVVFHTGETYLATGFNIGKAEGGMNHPVRYLARFCSKAWGGKGSVWLDWLGSVFDEGYEGEIDPDLLPRAPGPMLFDGD